MQDIKVMRVKASKIIINIESNRINLFSNFFLKPALVIDLLNASEGPDRGRGTDDVTFVLQDLLHHDLSRLLTLKAETS